MATPDTTEGTSAADASGATPARRYLEMIAEGERYFQTYNDKADNVDKLYADFDRLANTTREREMQVFWANLEVLKPSIYARPPVPVVVPRFKDRKPLPRLAAEFLERAITTSFATEDIDATMRQVRDDLAVNSRGVVWCRFAKKADGDPERVCYDHIDRKDFLHGPARKWQEVGWVARRAYLTRKEGLARFGDVWLKAEFKDRRQDGEEDEQKSEQKAGAWEIWDKTENAVVWVTKGVEEFLDKQEPYLNLDGFFPCPMPAYGTLQRRTLKPVPDLLQYKDQIEEINELTARISALSENLRLKGFYPAGATEVGDAVEAAIKNQSNNAILVPVSNWALLGGGAALKDAIVWLPVRDVAEVIKGLIELRRQLIEDVYQVTGLSDIMRGATDPNETLGAQELKSQYGSIRIRDRQSELVRIARDLTRIAGEIMAENFSPKTLLEMTQIDMPTDGAIAKQVQQLTAQKAKIGQLVEQAKATPQVQQAAQADPQRAQKLLQQAQQQMQALDGQIQKLQEQPTVEKVMAFLHDQRVRPFTLDIETDSTIAPDENAQKQRATEFVTATGGFMGQVVPLVAQAPQLAPLAAEFLKYVASQFRAGRELEGAIDEFADQMAQAAQSPAPDPAAQAEQVKAQAEQAKAQADLQAKQLDAQLKQQGEQRAAAAHTNALQLAQQESAAKVEATKLGMQQAAQKHQQDMQKGALEIKALQVKTASDVMGGMMKGQGEGGAKPPSTSVPFDSLPAEGQAQVAAQAGIKVTPAALAAEAAKKQAAEQAAAAAKKPPAPR